MVKDFIPVIASFAGALVALGGVFLSTRLNSQTRNEEYYRDKKLQKLDEISLAAEECVIWAERHFRDALQIALRILDEEKIVSHGYTPTLKVMRLTQIYYQPLLPAIKEFVFAVDEFHKSCSQFAMPGKDWTRENFIEMVDKPFHNVSKNKYDELLKHIAQAVENEIAGYPKLARIKAKRR